MVNLLFAIAPLLTLTIGLLLGLMLASVPIKSQRKKTTALGTFAVVTGVAALLGAWFYSNNLSSINLFRSFASTVQTLPLVGTLGGLAFTASVVLLCIFEATLGAGFGIAVKADLRDAKRKDAPPAQQASANAKPPTEALQTTTVTGKTRTGGGMFAFASMEASGSADDQALRKDEQSLMDLFLYGKVAQVTSRVNSAVPEGYVFDGAPQIDWETKRSRQVLDSLVRKGLLRADLTDKLIVCSKCGSANVRVKKLCPECMSLRLHKEGLIEHFACGAVDKQTAFETGNGDLVCPKCKAKLQLIGADYRMLPPAYSCMSCNSRNNEPLLVSKCSDCGATVELSEEPEIFLYKYMVNSEMPIQEMQQIKPIEACTKFFRSLGYTVVTPAFVSGKSGTRHLFDILILGRVGWVEPHPSVTTSTQRKDNGNTVIQLLISSKPTDVEEITRVYGMINDIECDSIIFVIPGLTDNARNYAAAYNMKISEGKNIEEALANSKIPKAGDKNN